MKPLLVVLLALHVAFAAAAKPSPTDLLGRFEYNNVQISPTGEYLAVAKMEGEDARFAIYQMPERKLTYSSNLGEKTEVAQMIWVNDDYLVVSPAQRIFRDVKVRTGELMSINAKTSKFQRLSLKDCPRCGGAILHTLPDDPKHIIVQGSFDQYAEAYRVNVYNGTFRKIARAAAPRGSFVADPAGNIIFSIGTNTENELEVHLKEGQKWELLERTAQDEEGWRPFANGAKPNTYLTWDSRGGGTRGLGLYNTKTKEHKMLYQFGEVDVGNVFYDHNYNVYAVQTDLHYPALHYLNDAHPLAKISKALQRNYPDDTITFTSSTRDSSQVIALIHGDRNPGNYFLVDLQAKKVELLFSRKPDLTPEMLAPMTPIEVKARDGGTVYGYVTSAQDTPKPGPMIVFIHGGPHGVRDYWGFNPAVQLMASQGAHVLQVNYRGSGGYGLEYEKSGYGEWGRLMQDDVTDATRWAIENKLADPQQICIYGGSYGAYSAMMGAAREPDLYRCAVGYSGIYDLTLMESAGDVRQRRSGIAFLRKVIGTDKDVLEANSPVSLAASIKAEVMLIHGVQDRRAPIEHAQRMRSALKRAGPRRRISMRSATLSQAPRSR